MLIIGMHMGGSKSTILGQGVGTNQGVPKTSMPNKNPICTAHARQLTGPQ